MIDAKCLKIMTFNIRYSTPGDGPFEWSFRRDAVVDAIRSFEPDLLGLQEVLSDQRNYLRLKMPEYQIVAAGRDDGLDAGEMTAILYRKDRFKFVDCGHFWLSPTPDIPGSVGWDASLPRIASWVRLVDSQNPITPDLFLLNTHLDHSGAQSRLESCKLIRQMIRNLSSKDAILITGDFNCTEDDNPYTELLGDDLQDIYRTLHPSRRSDEATFHAYSPDNFYGSRIDWIFADQHFNPTQVMIDQETYDDIVPSDHFPVKAVLE